MDNSYEVHDVLLADDDNDDVEIFSWAMQEAEIQHELRHAADGTRLFVLLKEKIPYILFLDVEMPGKDGLSCIREIRGNSAYDRLPVIIYSSHTYPNYLESAFRNSANLYMTKSVDAQTTVGHLKKIFSIDWRNYMQFPIFENFVLR